MRNPAGLCLTVFAACALAFTSVALNANWWTVELSVLSASGIDTLQAGDVAQAKFFLTKVKYYNEITGTGSSTETNYSEFQDFDRSNFNSIRGITIALISTSCILVLYGLSASGNPEKAAKGSPLMGFLSFACFALALTNLIIMAYIPNDVARAVYNNDAGAPTYTCGAATITWQGITFSGVTIECGNIWKTVQFSFSGTSSSAVVQWQTSGGSGWWWTFGSMLAFMFCTFASCSLGAIAAREYKQQQQQSGDSIEIDEPMA
jgi:hypothetical protein